MAVYYAFFKYEATTILYQLVIPIQIYFCNPLNHTALNTSYTNAGPKKNIEENTLKQVPNPYKKWTSLKIEECHLLGIANVLPTH